MLVYESESLLSLFLGKGKCSDTPTDAQEDKNNVLTHLLIMSLDNLPLNGNRHGNITMMIE